jgi:Uncharacterised ArCR, COG2043
MQSITAKKLRLAYDPVAILWSNTKPEAALQIKPHGQTCIMPFFAQVATRGKTAVFDRESYGCPGARAVLGYTDWRHGRTWERSSPIPCSPLPYPGNSFLRWKRKRGTAYSTARSGKIWHRRRKCYHDRRKFQGDRTEAGICVQASPTAARNMRSETLPEIVSTSRR